MRSVSGHKQRLEGETVGKTDAFPSILSASRLKRELLEAVAGGNPRLNREFISQFIIDINKCK